jgi:hypothetical protein
MKREGGVWFNESGVNGAIPKAKIIGPIPIE